MLSTREKPIKEMLRLWLSLVLIINSHVLYSLSSSFSTLNKPQCHPDESAALLKLTTLKLFWSESTDCCTWFGVTCDETTGHVIGVDFFVGTLSSLTPNSSLFSLRHLHRLDLSARSLEIDAATFKALARNLTNLRELDLSYNDMSSVPPVLLTGLTSSLKSLSLSRCLLRGTLPDGDFSRFSKLEILDLSWNGLNGNVPRSLLSLECLTSLSLSHNNFEGQLPRLPSSLASLSLSNNSISGPIPSWIYALPNLKELQLGTNLLTGKIGKFQSPSLTNLVLSGNKLHGVIPRSIFQLAKLEELDLSSNNLTGTIELGELSLLKNLTNLDLSSNSLSSFSFDNPTNYSSENTSLLASLDLSNNQLKGGFPKWFWGVGKDSLEYLNLSYNSLTHIDSLLWNKLDTLDLSSNLFSGNIPLLSPYLKSFAASKNQFSENIPPSICNLKFLMGLDLSYNNISGQIPKCIGNFSLLVLRNNKLHGTVPMTERSKLQYLDLGSNMFSGPLPILSYNTSIFLSVSKNRFSGEIPDSICDFKSLVLLDLSDNNFSGKIPQCIGNLSEYLTVLDLRRNNLRGTIPGILAIGKALTSLNLNGNQLEGALPRSLANCSNLEVLDLGNNALNDTFPYWLESLPALQVLVLRANKFRGSIGNPLPGSPPAFLKLRIIDLSCNEFAGALPTEYLDNFQAMKTGAKNAKMGYMGEEYYHESVMVSMKGSYIQLERIQTILATIDLSDNNFSGEIPKSMGSLISLKGLILARNNLAGTIPSSMGNLANLEWLDLSSNNLVGHIPGELVDIPWLSFLNLSHNRLEGPIPHGKQFNTFGNESFAGNIGLCGFPLTKTCGHDENKLKQNGDRDSRIGNGFNSKIVMMGYASGFVIGISIGYVLLHSNGKLGWLSETILEEIQYRSRPRRTPKRSTNARPY